MPDDSPSKKRNDVTSIAEDDKVGRTQSKMHEEADFARIS